MPRRGRKDYAGAWWHIGNRGVEKRTLFHNRKQGRFFESLVARTAVREQIEVHAYAVMPNHFHLFLRSLLGRISETMQWIEYRYARRFNRKQGRSGALLQGRFWGKLIENQRYRRAVPIYVDLNPQRAGLGPHTKEFFESSLSYHASGRGRPWLTRRFVRSLRPERDTLPPELVRRWLSNRAPDTPELDPILGGSLSHAIEWLQKMAAPDVPTHTSYALVLPATLRQVIREEKRENPEIMPRSDRRKADSWSLALPGMLHTLADVTIPVISREYGVPETTVRRRVALHREAVRSDLRYASTVARVLLGAIARDYDGPTA